MYNFKNFKNKLLESPDNLYYNNKYLKVNDSDSISFAIDIDGNLKISEKGESHSDLRTNNYFNWDDNSFYGRLWLNSKLISFWRIKKDNEEKIDINSFIKNIKKLENILKKEYLIDKNENLLEWDVEYEGDFIKIKDLKGNFETDEESLIYHLMNQNNPKRKNRIKPEMFGSKYDKRPLKWKQNILKSEKFINNFNEFTFLTV